MQKNNNAQKAQEEKENTVLTVDEYRLVLAGFSPMWVDNGEWDGRNP